MGDADTFGDGMRHAKKVVWRVVMPDGDAAAQSKEQK
jgi:hypothetical protein